MNLMYMSPADEGELVNEQTYSLAEQAVAEADMERVRKYIERNQNTMKGKK